MKIISYAAVLCVLLGREGRRWGPLGIGWDAGATPKPLGAGLLLVRADFSWDLRAQGADPPCGAPFRRAEVKQTLDRRAL